MTIAGRAKRQKLIAEMIRGSAVASQEEVTAKLARHGIRVTQATVSRDLDQLGAIKVKRGGTLCYALSDQIGNSDWQAGHLQRIFADWVRFVEAAGNLIVMKTPPGSAHLVGVAIDQAALPEVAGTICGDDTVFVALRDGVTTATVADRFSSLAFPDPASS